VAVTIQLSLDRFEGRGKEIAVLVSEDGTSLNVPKSFLPAGVKAGDVLKLTLEADPVATETLARDTARLQKELEKTDPGGDITL
jgi:hypothetical protein